MFLLRLTVSTLWLQHAAFSARLAPVLLTAAGVMTILDDSLATATSTLVDKQFRDHDLTIPLITST